MPFVIWWVGLFKQNKWLFASVKLFLARVCDLAFLYLDEFYEVVQQGILRVLEIIRPLARYINNCFVTVITLDRLAFGGKKDR